jgi:eukaryotic-like serine/threonine-protein kinase
VTEAPSIFGSYALLRPLGRGGMGDVHLARPLDPNMGLPKIVVIKRMLSELAAHERFVKRFEHEAQIATRVDSPHVAKVYDVGRVDDVLYIAMEYIAGWPLSRVIAALRDSGRRVSVRSAIDVAADALDGLAALHGARDATGQLLGIVHRDISPKNIMIGEDAVVRLIDLGIGKSRLQDWKTKTGAILGTPGYMPPEQVRGNEIDHRADLYALGVVLWELLTLSPYVTGRGPQQVLMASLEPRFRRPSDQRADVPPELDALLERALRSRSNERIASAEAFARELRAIMTSEGERPPIRTLVADLLSEELEEATTVVARLLAAPLPEPEIEAKQQRTVIYAVAPGVHLDEGALFAPTQVRAPASRVAPVVPPHPAPARSTSPRPVVRGAALAAALGVVFFLGISFERARRPEPAQKEPLSPVAEPRAIPGVPAPIADAGAFDLERTAVAPPPTPPAPKIEPSKKTSSPKSRPTVKRPAEDDRSAESEGPELLEERGRDLELRRTLDRLLTDANALLERSPGRRAEIQALIVDITLLRSSTGLLSKQGEITALEDRLRALERR